MRRVHPVIIVLLLCCLLFSACRGTPTEKEPLLRAYFLDVGQGDCTLLRTSEGDVLIDCGPEASQESLCRKLKAYGVERLSLLILTHPDEDHIGGADAILEVFPTDSVFVNGADDENESAVRLEEILRNGSSEVAVTKAGDSFPVGEALITVLYPFEDTDIAKGNRGSLVIRVQIGTVAILMMGDAERETEAALLERYGKTHLAADVLHVGHHGSDTSCGEEFLRAVAPRYAVISCGMENRYGHPDGRTLARLKEIGAEVYRTDLSGDVLLTFDGENLQCV